MTEAKHTPGDWSFSNGNLMRVQAPNGDTVCGVHRIGRLRGKERDGEAEANGLLLAASSRMLRTLRDVEGWLVVVRDSSACNLSRVGAEAQLIGVRAAIAKATGQ
jgi:hypothetical protein